MARASFGVKLTLHQDRKSRTPAGHKGDSFVTIQQSQLTSVLFTGQRDTELLEPNMYPVSSMKTLHERIYASTLFSWLVQNENAVH